MDIFFALLEAKTIAGDDDFYAGIPLKAWKNLFNIAPLPYRLLMNVSEEELIQWIDDYPEFKKFMKILSGIDLEPSEKTVQEADTNASGFFTDSKGRVHPVEDSAEAVRYAQKMGFKHSVGGVNVPAPGTPVPEAKNLKSRINGLVSGASRDTNKKAMEKSLKNKQLQPREVVKEKIEKLPSRAKIIIKNVLFEAAQGVSLGLGFAFGRRGGMNPKVLGTMAMIGAGAGAVWGGAESAIKWKLLADKTKEQQKKTVSSPAYIAGNLAQLSVYGVGMNYMVDHVITKLTKDAGAEESVKKAGWLMSKLVKHPKVAAGVAFATMFATAVGADILNDTVRTGISNKVWGADKESSVEEERLLTQQGLKNGIFSGKEYKNGGFWGTGRRTGRRKEDVTESAPMSTDNRKSVAKSALRNAAIGAGAGAVHGSEYGAKAAGKGALMGSVLGAGIGAGLGYAKNRFLKNKRGTELAKAVSSNKYKVGSIAADAVLHGGAQALVHKAVSKGAIHAAGARSALAIFGGGALASAFEDTTNEAANSALYGKDRKNYVAQERLHTSSGARVGAFSKRKDK